MNTILLKLVRFSLGLALLVGCSTSTETDAFFTGTGGAGFGQFGASALQFSPVNYDFGPQRIFNPSAPVNLTLRNTSSYSVYISAIGSPANPNFSVAASDCPLGASNPMTPASSCSITVIFNPVTVGQTDYGFTVKYSGGTATSEYSVAAALAGIGATDVVFPGVQSISNIRARSVQLNWTDVTNENGYAYFIVSGGSLLFQGVTPSNATSATVTGLLPNTNYTFRVRAFDYFGALESNTTDLSATTLPDPAPTNIADRSYASFNPLQVGATLSGDIDNTVTASDALMTYTCIFDYVMDGSVSSGPDCSTIPGMTLDASFSSNGIFSFTPPATSAGLSYELSIGASDGSVSIPEIIDINVKSTFKYDGTLLAAYQASNANGYSPGSNAPFTSTWSNLATTGGVMDATLANGAFPVGWAGAGVWSTNPFKLNFAGTSGATADRAVAGTFLNAQPALMFTSWIRPTNTALGSTAYVFGNRGTGTDGWSVRQRSDGFYELIVGTSTGGSYSSAVMANTPALYFKFDEVAGAVAYDEVSMTNKAITNNATAAKGGAGAYGGSTSFNITSTAKIDLAPAIDLTAAGWAVTAWIKTPVPNTGFYKTLTRGTQDHHFLFQDSTNLFGVYYNSGGTWQSSGVDADLIAPGWHHFGVVGTGGNTRFYLDGAFVSQVPLMATDDITTVGNYGPGTQPIHEVDDVAIFTHPLTDAEVNAIYVGGCSTAVAQNTWTNLGGRFNGTLAELFKDGTKICDYNATGTLTGSVDNFTIGAQNAGTEAWPGDIGNLYVYSSGTAAEVLSNYSADVQEFRLPSSCAAWYAAGYTTSGTYAVDIDGTGPLSAMTVECDMVTDGGGWTLVLNYLHQGGTNPGVNSRTTSFPVIASSVLGTDEQGVAASWGHAAPSLLTNLSYTSMRFYCRSSNHARTFHIKSSSTNCKTYFTTGTGACNDINGTYAAIAGHSGVTPGTALDGNYTNQGNTAMTDFPYYRAGNNHWGIRGAGTRWECDDYPNNSAFNTLHRVWVK